MEPTIAWPFTRDDFRHELLKQSGPACLVARSNLRLDPPSVHWEVVLLQFEPTKTIKNQVYEAHWRYPGNEDWGTHGWTYTKLEEAERRFAELAGRKT